MFAGIKIVDVRPVGDQHSVPSQVLFQPFCKEFVVGMHRLPVDGTAVDHYSQCACFYTGLERSKAFLTQFGNGYISRCAVFAGTWYAVSHVMFYGCSNPISGNMVRIVSLKASNSITAHNGID